MQRRREEPDGNDWYQASTMQDVLQATGRIVRSIDDWGTTYILDAHFDWMLERNRAALPSWFLARIDAGRELAYRF